MLEALGIRNDREALFLRQARPQSVYARFQCHEEGRRVFGKDTGRIGPAWAEARTATAPAAAGLGPPHSGRPLAAGPRSATAGLKRQQL